MCPWGREGSHWINVVHAFPGSTDIEGEHWIKDHVQNRPKQQ